MARPATVAPSGALLYLRVSTMRQATDGIGLDTQEAACRAHAVRLSLPVLGVYRDEGASGKDGLEDRPGLAALVETFTHTPGAVVVVYSVSRLARRQRVLWQLLDEREGHGLRVASATEAFETATPMGKAMLGMLAVWAQLEGDLVSQRTRDGLAELKAQGRQLGAPSMIRRVEPDGRHVLDESKMRRVQQVQALYETGVYSHKSLAMHLNSTGVATVTGRGTWWAKTVRTALALEVFPEAS